MFHYNAYSQTSNNISGPDTVCVGAIDEYSVNPTAGLSYYWQVSFHGHLSSPVTSTEKVITWNTSGSATVIVKGITQFGAIIEQDTLNVQVMALPQPEMPLDIFGPDSICPLYIMYTFSTGPEIFGTILNWSIDGGLFTGSSSGPETSIVLTGQAPYTLKVWRELANLSQCTSDTITKILDVKNIHFSVVGQDTVCPNSFESYTTTYENAELYEWSINPSTAGSVAMGDGTNSVEVLWNHTSTNINAQVVAKLRECNTFYQETLNVVIVGNPVLNIVAPNEVCREETFYPELQSTPTLNSGTVLWNFGDQNTAMGNPTEHAYTSLQTSDVNFTISATVINPNGCDMSLTTTKNILVKPAPVAFITPPGTQGFCEENEVDLYLYANLQSGFEPTGTLEWYEFSAGLLDDCITPFSCNPLYVDTYGTYYVVAIGENGCAAKSNEIRIIQHCPTGGGTCTFASLPEVNIDLVIEECGHVFLEGSYDAGGMNPFWTYSGQPININTSATTFEADYTTPGLYMFTYNVEYLDDLSNVCTLSVQHMLIVPVIAGMKYGIACNQTTPGYDVTLYDHTEYFPGTSFSFSYFIDQTLENGPTSNTQYTHHLSPGSYNLAVEVDYTFGNLTGQCLADANVVLPDLPQANFSFTPETNVTATCEGIPIAFTNLSTPAVGLSYMWDFGDISFNTQQHPFKVYSGEQIFPASLTVTNAYGCIADTAQQVNIIANPFTQISIDVLSGECALDGAELDVNITGNAQPPYTFIWFNHSIPVLNTSYAPVLVFQTGMYWVTAINENSCKATSPAQYVLLANEPAPVYIESKAVYCEGSAFVLQGIAGSDAVDFQWYMNQTLMQSGSASTYEVGGLDPGVYEFELWAGVGSLFTSGYCYGKSEIHLITIIEVPDEPSLVASLVSCDPYHFKIEAISNNPGLFTWSNGMQGDIIDVYQGGGYKVTFNDGSGCIVSEQHFVPKDPYEYLWIFPNGCHKVCDRLDPPFITLFGPIPYFEDWMWDHSNQGDFSGQGFVDSFEIDIDGTINLTLDNGYCVRTSDDLELEFMDCECDIDYYISATWEDEIDDLCVSYLEICIDNNTGFDMIVNISPQFHDIIYVPSTLLVPANGDCFIVQTIAVEPQQLPYNTSIYLTGLVFHDSDEPYPYCFMHDYIQIDHLCDNSSKPEALQITHSSHTVHKPDWLKLYPNPSTGIIQLTWVDLETEAPLQLDVFNVFGAALFSRKLNSNTNSESLDLTHLPAGIYFIRVSQLDYGSQTHRVVVHR